VRGGVETTAGGEARARARASADAVQGGDDDGTRGRDV
jgi:hypothetical protein